MSYGSSLVNIIADSAHNFTDGLAIAGAFLHSRKLGISTAVAVFFHEIPHEIGDYGILIGNGMSHWSAIRVQFLTAIASLLGTVFGLIMDRYKVFSSGSGNAESVVASWALPITAGGFIYVALADVLPDLLRQGALMSETLLQVAAMGLGVFMMTLVGMLE
eukprot:CAMPEP_0170173244 /NCGR_PEP_ID=MMETSP0040_2-20121228/6520_1 /TAXON_ID=641309 /ORGANISM="Lotharella oceanica, Strain CCMP622" /LENGTH=160 /DNA_ID=CAMNT_0010414335 /DNA_START=81 /DNA_END=563 /DNA_ORIENTATION=+